MNRQFAIKIITPETPAKEIIGLSYLSGPYDKGQYKKLMKDFIANSLSADPDFDVGIVYGLYEGEQLIASARIKQDEYTFDAASIEYVAVQPDYRGQGLGKIFMEGLFKELKERWDKEIAILATADSKGFYEKIGMTLWAELTKELGYPRFYFYKKLN